MTTTGNYSNVFYVRHWAHLTWVDRHASTQKGKLGTVRDNKESIVLVGEA
jgi:hypothetical protein